MAEHAGLSLTVWQPLAGGFLTGKFGRGGATSEQQARRVRSGDFVPFDEEDGFKVLDVLRAVAARHEVSPARVAIAWLLAQRAVTSVFVGARKLDQLSDNIAASGLVLTERDLAELDEISRPPAAYPNWIQAGFAPARTPAANLA
jgi:aryl-alcohol dehydrogenase-like predicted oxidoreductase